VFVAAAFARISLHDGQPLSFVRGESALQQAIEVLARA
jgi:hypothetical protein